MTGLPFITGELLVSFCSSRFTAKGAAQLPSLLVLTYTYLFTVCIQMHSANGHAMVHYTYIVKSLNSFPSVISINRLSINSLLYMQTILYY